MNAGRDVLDVGAVVGETYRIEGLIGRGGMGAVWAAEHLRLPGKHVAVKVLLDAAAGGDEMLQRFRREAEIASRLGHPNIVEVLDFNTLPTGQPYIVLEYLQGETLAGRLASGRLQLDEALAITRQIGSALQAAHRAGVVHRDLKPDNVFLCTPEEDLPTRVKVLDFGISKIRGSQSLRTQDAILMGTPQYMSPEQATGKNTTVDARTDVFALGAIVYEMLGGQPAFAGGSLAEVVYRVVHGAAHAAARARPGPSGQRARGGRARAAEGPRPRGPRTWAPSSSSSPDGPCTASTPGSRGAWTRRWVRRSTPPTPRARRARPPPGPRRASPAREPVRSAAVTLPPDPRARGAADLASPRAGRGPLAPRRAPWACCGARSGRRGPSPLDDASAPLEPLKPLEPPPPPPSLPTSPAVRRRAAPGGDPARRRSRARREHRARRDRGARAARAQAGPSRARADRARGRRRSPRPSRRRPSSPRHRPRRPPRTG